MMSNQNFIKAAGSILSIATILHLLRILFGWTAVMGGWEVPMWVSILVVIVAGYLSFSACRLLKKI